MRSGPSSTTNAPSTDRPGDAEPDLEPPQVAVEITEFAVAHDQMGLVSSTSWGRRCGASRTKVASGQSAAEITLPMKKRHAGEGPAGQHAHREHDELAAQQQHEHVQRLRPGREAQDAPVQSLRGVCERGVGERVLAEQRAVRPCP